MLIALVWCTLVSISRIYLGVHSFADIYMGLIVGLMLLVPVLPLAEYSDFWLLSSPYAPFVLTAIELLGLYFYPGSDRWTPARCVGEREQQVLRLVLCPSLLCHRRRRLRGDSVTLSLCLSEFTKLNAFALHSLPFIRAT